MFPLLKSELERTIRENYFHDVYLKPKWCPNLLPDFLPLKTCHTGIDSDSENFQALLDTPRWYIWRDSIRWYMFWPAYLRIHSVIDTYILNCPSSSFYHDLEKDLAASQDVVIDLLTEAPPGAWVWLQEGRRSPGTMWVSNLSLSVCCIRICKD